MTTFLDDALAYSARGWAVIPIRHKSPSGKEPACTWKRFQQKRPDEAQLRSWFGKGSYDGLAVILGDVSGGLVCRDFDKLDAYHEWADAQPTLASRLPTVETARGRHVYFESPHRGIRNFADGELRGGGYCLVPRSVHPSGTHYEWLVQLPDGRLPIIPDPFRVGLAPCVTERTERTEKTERTDAMGGRAPRPTTVEEAIVNSLPTSIGQRNRKLFELARQLKALPEYANAGLSELQPIIREWHQKALPVIGTKPFDDSVFDFLYGWERVQFPAGSEPLTAVFKRALASELPPEALQFDSDETRLLIAFCRELQREAGDGPFFLDCRTAARRIGIDHMTASRRLNGLVSCGILELVEKGKRGRASRYRYNVAGP